MTDITIDEDELFALNRELKKMNKELRQLRKEKQRWQKVCAYEKEKWMPYIRCFPDKISEEEKEHFNNMNILARDK